MFNWKKPTVQMLGRWQPWHDGHQALFKRLLPKLVKLLSRYVTSKGLQVEMIRMIILLTGMRYVKI